MTKYTISWGAAIKPGEESREDAHQLSTLQDNRQLVAIADGAGGKGVFVGKWAQTLLDNLPPTPFENSEAIKSWFIPVAVDFYKACKPIAQQQEHTWSKFLQEGSAATLTALWLPPEETTDTPDANVFCFMYGDSPMMRYNSEQNTLQMPEHLPTLSNFSHRTPLLNWSGHFPMNPEHCHILQFPPANELVLLATDALAQLILIRYLLSKPEEESCQKQLEDAKQAGGLHAQLIAANQNADLPPVFNEWLTLLLSTLNTTENETGDSFKTLLYQWFEQGLVEEDDYTLIAIQPNPS